MPIQRHKSSTRLTRRCLTPALLGLALLALAGCCLHPRATPALQTKQIVSAQPFGRLEDGRAASLYTLTNAKGMTVGLTDYGATVVNLLVPDRNGKIGDVALGFTSVKGYTGKDNP